jgi:hypothetical protein
MTGGKNFARQFGLGSDQHLERLVRGGFSEGSIGVNDLGPTAVLAMRTRAPAFSTFLPKPKQTSPFNISSIGFSDSAISEQRLGQQKHTEITIS